MNGENFVGLEITESGIRLASAYRHYKVDVVNDRDGLRQACGPCSEALHSLADDEHVNVAWPCEDYIWIVRRANS